MNGFRKGLGLATASLLFAGGLAFGQNQQDNHQQENRPPNGYQPGNNNGHPTNNSNRPTGPYNQPGTNGQGNNVRPGDNSVRPGGYPNSGNTQGNNYNRPGGYPNNGNTQGNNYNRPGGYPNNGNVQGNNYNRPGDNHPGGYPNNRPGNYGPGGNGFGPGNNGYVHHDDWQRGHRMAPNDWGRAQRIDDYRRYHLSAPPRGYEWRQVDGNYVLAAVTTGIIASVVAASLAH